MSSTTRLLATLALLSLPACATPAKAPRPGAPLRVGLIVPLTGRFAAFGAQEVEAAMLALTVFEERGGLGQRPVRLVVDDSRREAERGVRAFEELADEGVNHVYVASSDVAVAVAPLAEERGTLLMTDAASGRVAELCSRTLRHCPDARDECDVLLAHAVANGARRLALLHVDTPYGEAYVEPFRRSADALDTRGVAVVPFPETTAAFDVVAERLLAPRPDAVLAIGYGPSLANAIAAVRERERDLPIYAAASVAYPVTYDAAPDAVDGAFYADVALDLSEPEAAEMLRRWRRTHASDELPSPLVAMTYDAFSLLFAAIAAVGEDPEAVRAWAIEGGARGEHRGASGTFRVLPDGRLQFELTVLRRTAGVPVIADSAFDARRAAPLDRGAASLAGGVAPARDDGHNRRPGSPRSGTTLP